MANKKYKKQVSTKEDRKNTICTKCKKGTYQETSMYDDLDGILYCTECNHGIFRWPWVEET